MRPAMSLQGSSAFPQVGEQAARPAGVEQGRARRAGSQPHGRFARDRGARPGPCTTRLIEPLEVADAGEPFGQAFGREQASRHERGHGIEAASMPRRGRPAAPRATRRAAAPPIAVFVRSSTPASEPSPAARWPCSARVPGCAARPRRSPSAGPAARRRACRSGRPRPARSPRGRRRCRRPRRGPAASSAGSKPSPSSRRPPSARSSAASAVARLEPPVGPAGDRAAAARRPARAARPPARSRSAQRHSAGSSREQMIGQVVPRPRPPPRTAPPPRRSRRGPRRCGQPPSWPRPSASGGSPRDSCCGRDRAATRRRRCRASRSA